MPNLGAIISTILPSATGAAVRHAAEMEETVLAAVLAGCPEDQAQGLVQRMVRVTPWSLAEIRYRFAIQGAQRQMECFPAPSSDLRENT